MKLPIIAAGLLPLLMAQPPRRFEAVSIRPNRSSLQNSETETTPGRMSLLNATAISVIRRAFGVPDSQIEGAPSWAGSERFDIVAVTGGADRLSDRERQAFL